ncbi:MAG: GntR family transcriptional regulator [Lentisphaerota bacterium]
MNKLERVSSGICADIASGKIPPGAKLPTYEELERIHKVSYITINNCIKLLKNSGLVVGRERTGVFVTERPPILNRFAMIFPKEALFENRFLQTILKVLEEESVKRDLKFEIFQDFEPHVDNPDYQKLLSELQKMRIGGIAHFSMPELPNSCELLHFPGIPAISMSACLDFDYKTYADKACDYLISRKKRRIAVLFQGKARMINTFIEKRDNSEMSSPDHWFIPVGQDVREGAETICRILLDYPKEKRPNGLIITDDNLVDHALKGVFTSRVKVPEELEIVTHSNWPNPVTSVIPVKKLGFDVRKTVSILINIMLKSRGKSGYQKMTPVPLVPLFEEELQ